MYCEGGVTAFVSRPCRRRRPSSRDAGGVSGLFSSGGPSVRFLTRYDGEVSGLVLGFCTGLSSMHSHYKVITIIIVDNAVIF